MTKGFNKTTLLGNLTKDPETRTTTSGNSVTSFTLAVTLKYGDKENTSFINCVAWGKLGEIIAQYASKGSPLLVSGRLEQRGYEDKDGNKRSVFEVVVDEFNFIGSKSDSDRQSDDRPLQQHEVLDKAKEVVPEDIDDRPIDLSEIPF